MLIPAAPHPWRVTAQQAVNLQRRLAGCVRRARPRGALRYVAGVDAALSADERFCLAAAVVWDMARREVVDCARARSPVRFPYVPGLLSFRETPAVIAALRKLAVEPDVIMCDAHGYAHPRRFGLACHVGVICRRSTIGCAKSRLIGDHREPLLPRGAHAALRQGAEIIGSVLRTQKAVRPVYVSVGHLIDLGTARRIVLACATRYRLPEPTRLADQVVRASTRHR
jgi:deoxyribonuclease V